jgi:hypothetical protein
MAEERGYPINWGSRGFSLNAPREDGTVKWVCLGYPVPERSLQSAQNLQITFREIEKDTPSAQALTSEFRPRFLDTGLFVPAGSFSSIKYWISETPSDEQVREIVMLVQEIVEAVKRLDWNEPE